MAVRVCDLYRHPRGPKGDRGSSGGTGCGGCLLTILLLWALWFGLPWPGGAKYNIDIFPPRVWDMNAVEAAAPSK